MEGEGLTGGRGSLARLETEEEREDIATELNALAQIVVDVGFHLHQAVGPGLLEKVYGKLLAYDLREMGLRVQMEVPLSIRYKGLSIDKAYYLDLLVNEKLPVEIKAVEANHPVHAAQLLTYLKCGDYRLGLLMNFGMKYYRKGVKRVVNGL